MALLSEKGKPLDPMVSLGLQTWSLFDLPANRDKNTKMCEVYLSNVFFFWLGGGIKKQNEHVKNIHVLSEESQPGLSPAHTRSSLAAMAESISKQVSPGCFDGLEIWFPKEKKPQKR